MEYILIGILLMVAGFVVTIFNRFKSLELQAEAALSNIDVVLMKRYDILTNMI